MSWASVNTGLANRYVLALAMIGTTLFAGTYFDGGVFRSTNNGADWTAASNGLTNMDVLALAAKGAALFAGTAGDGIFRSTDDGVTWTAVNTGLLNTTVGAFAVSGTTIFVGTLSGVFRSTDNGSTWLDASNGLTNNTVLALATSGTSLFAGTLGGGVFHSTNNGTDWNEINDGLTMLNVRAFAVGGTNLFAGIDDDGVWRRPLSEITSVETPPMELPALFSIKQNYPNPFNPATTIEYTLPAESDVIVKLYSVLGQEVTTLVSETQKRGSHRVRWDGTSSNGTTVATGVYFLQFEAVSKNGGNAFRQVRKMLLAR
jgi:hypothetical protein